MTRSVSTRLTEKEYAQLLAVAKGEERSVSYLVRKAVLALLRETGAQAGLLEGRPS